MKRKFFLVINYIQIILCLLLIGWIFGYKRMSLFEGDYIGFIVFSIPIIFIANSLTNIISANAFVNQLFANKAIATTSFILTVLYILSVFLMFFVSLIAFYSFFFERTDNPRFNFGIPLAMLVSIMSIIVLGNQFYFRKYLKKECRKQLESEIDIIGSDPSTYE